MFPYGNPADALGDSNLLVAAPAAEAEVEDTLLLRRQMTGNELVNVCQSFVLAVAIGNLFCHQSFFRVQFHILVTQPLETLISDARQQIAFFRIRQQDRLPMKQALEDIADHILALLLVVKDGARHPVHLGIMLSEQPLDYTLFHHVFYYNTLQTLRMLTPTTRQARKSGAGGESLRHMVPVTWCAHYYQIIKKLIF